MRPFGWLAAASARVAPVLVTAVLLGCSQTPEPPVDMPPDILATFSGGAVSRDDVDQAILALPPKERQAFGAQSLDAYRELVRDLATERLLVQDARREGTEEDAEFLNRKRAREREVAVDRWLRTTLPPLELPTEAELRERYERQPERRQRPERRLVYNLFRRAGDPDKDAAEAELRALRDQIIAGANFGVLAGEHSDSESRHQQGQMGWYEPGQLPQALDAIVFALDQGVPSEPLRTRDGVHLFFVATLSPSQLVTFDLVRAAMHKRLVAERTEEALRQLEDTITLPDDALIPTPGELQKLLADDDPDPVLMRIGDFSLRRAQFRQQLAEMGEEDDPLGRPAANRLFDRIRRRELFFQEAHQQAADPEQRQRSDGQPSDAQPSDATPADAVLPAGTVDALLGERHLERLVEQALDGLGEPIRAFHAEHAGRFAQPVRWTIERLSIPLRPDAPRLMEQLEAAASRGEPNRITQLAAKHEGRISRLEDLTLDALKAGDEKLAFYTSSLDVGEQSPPFRTLNAIEIVRVVDRHEPAAPPLETIAPLVREAYLRVHGQELVDSILTEMLEAADYELLDAHLEQWIKAPRDDQPAEPKPETATP